MPVLGICNGFQILCESHLLPGALIRNDHRKFGCLDQVLRIENANTAWTTAYAAGQEITIVLKNGEGSYVADQHTLDLLEGEGRVVARYVEEPQRLPARDRRRHQRGRQRGRADAAPRARGRGPHRSRHRRARLLHQRDRRAPARLRNGRSLSDGRGDSAFQVYQPTVLVELTPTLRW